MFASRCKGIAARIAKRVNIEGIYEEEKDIIETKTKTDTNIDIETGTDSDTDIDIDIDIETNTDADIGTSIYTENEGKNK